MVTAYDAPSARLADAQGIDLVLVGDSAAMVVIGHESTVPVTLDEMLMLTAAVARGTRRALVVGDLPFGSYQVSDEAAVSSAVRIVKDGGADLVKLEGSERRPSRIRAIVDAGIPVMGHIGLTPQSATMLGGYRPQGQTAGARAICMTPRSRSRRLAAPRSSWKPSRPRSSAEAPSCKCQIADTFATAVVCRLPVGNCSTQAAASSGFCCAQRWTMEMTVSSKRRPGGSSCKAQVAAHHRLACRPNNRNPAQYLVAQVTRGNLAHPRHHAIGICGCPLLGSALDQIIALLARPAGRWQSATPSAAANNGFTSDRRQCLATRGIVRQ